MGRMVRRRLVKAVAHDAMCLVSGNRCHEGEGRPLSTLLVATESHCAVASDGRVHSTTGVDTYAFWQRYLDIFERVVIVARTRLQPGAEVRGVVEGPGV